MTKKNQYPPDPDYDRIMEMFRHCCVHCPRAAVTVHEIIPRSSGKIAMNIENRVAICAECHNWAHKGTKISIPILQKEREEVLARYADHAAEV